MTNNEKWVYDESLNQSLKTVATITIGEETWKMDYDEFKKAKDEGRTIPIIYLDKLIFVDTETASDLKILEEWLKNNKLPNADDYQL